MNLKKLNLNEKADKPERCERDSLTASPCGGMNDLDPAFRVSS